MRHQGAGRRDRVNQTLLDHVADHEIHLAHGHGATDRQETHAFLSLVIASSAFAPRATCAARPPYGGSFDTSELDGSRLAVDPFVERRINHRHDIARIGKHRVGKIAVTNLPGPRHVEGIDKNSSPLLFIDRLRVPLGKSADDDDIFPASLRFRILRWVTIFLNHRFATNFLSNLPNGASSSPS